MRCGRVARPLRGQVIMIWPGRRLASVQVTASLSYGKSRLRQSRPLHGCRGNFPVDIGVPEDVLVDHEAGKRGLAGSLVVPNESGLDWGPNPSQPRAQTPDCDDTD